MTWRVTHVDHDQRRRQLVLECDTGATAAEIACALLGAALYLAAIRLGKPR